MGEEALGPQEEQGLRRGQLGHPHALTPGPPEGARHPAEDWGTPLAPTTSRQG